MSNNRSIKRHKISWPNSNKNILTFKKNLKDEKLKLNIIYIINANNIQELLFVCRTITIIPT